MSESNNPNASAAHWEKYWNGSSDIATFGEGGVNHPFLQSFWQSYFSITVDLDKRTRILDVASGTGAVLIASGLNPSDESLAITCVDSSAGALTSLSNQFPAITTLQCDAAQIPLEKQSFDIVTSQFGVEYAGINAIHLLPAFVATQGQLSLILHHSKSSIYAECLNNAIAIEHLMESNFIPLAQTMFTAGFAVLTGEDDAEFRAASQTLLPVFKSLEPIMDRYGIDVAGGTISTMYNKVSEIQNNLSSFTEEEVQQWLEQMSSELPAYVGRMRGMCSAALTPQEFQRLCESIIRQGFRMLEAHPVETSEQEPPIAWMIIAEKSAD